MYCDQCGSQMQDHDRFCASCGKSFARETPAATLPQKSSSHNRFKVAGVLMIIYAVFLLAPGGVMTAIPLHRISFGGPGLPMPIMTLLSVLGPVMMLLAAGGIIAGIGVINHQPWGRVLAIGFACLILLEFPFGTALGAFILFTLFSADAESWFRPQAV